MGIDATPIRNAGSGTWSFTWPVGSPPYLIYLDGILKDTVATEVYEYTESDYEDTPPPLEILSTGDPVESVLFPPRFRIQWRGLVLAAAYVVEEFTGGSGGVWVEIMQVMERGTGYYLYETLPLEDAIEHMFRVIALDSPGNEGAPLAFSSEIMRNPAPPDVAITIAAGDIVVSAA